MSGCSHCIMTYSVMSFLYRYAYFVIYYELGLRNWEQHHIFNEGHPSAKSCGDSPHKCKNARWKYEKMKMKSYHKLGCDITGWNYNTTSRPGIRLTAGDDWHWWLVFSQFTLHKCLNIATFLLLKFWGGVMCVDFTKNVIKSPLAQSFLDTRSFILAIY